MSGELYDRESPDAEDFFISLLQPVMRAAVERTAGDPYPFAIVQQLPVGKDNPDYGTTDVMIQVDFLDIEHDGRSATANAKLTARRGHRAITYAAQHLSDVLLSNAKWANADYITTDQAPTPMPYVNESVARYTARYNVGFSYVAADN